MKKHKLTIKPAIEPEDRHYIEKALKKMGYSVHGGGQYVDGSASDISFDEK